ncbi:hypothetical protein M2103_000643 [Ereboglobus sp. PH5-5]|uniref:hypothetical protein n=1 Tax=unclassified Ereboglobus TaxID=2626932 RepID=UPI002404CB0E|nr:MULTISPECIES: hypothetical protein [unclassified Ereboglobus]MDF9828200.1 hypothetical protein [Ereboglobus sp. PH5-10]MDF9832433.1 hypothetical protein [Ereboglobus sp. PH5-5]
MKTYLYFTLAPESLVASHLPPAEFGNYIAVGPNRNSSGQAQFFEIDPEWRTDALPMRDIAKRCVPHPDGAPRKSTYLAIYRVLEHIPLSAIGDLHLATASGMVLSLKAKNDIPPETEDRFHLYQEYCPAQPRVVSIYGPARFGAHLTDPAQPVSVPKLIFAELKLGNLARNPEATGLGNLPYPNIDHLRDCLREFTFKPAKPTKVFIRNVSDAVLYRTIRNGYYVGQQNDIKHYPLPSIDELETTHLDWWRAAQNVFGG